MVAQWRLLMNCVNHDYVKGFMKRFQGNKGMRRR